MDIYLHFGTCIVGLNNIGLNNIGPNIIGPNNVGLDTDNFVDFDDFVAFIRNCQKMSENCPNVSKSVRT